MDTSIIAFRRIKDELPTRQLSVYQAVRALQCATNSMIAKYLNLPINCVTGRCKELRVMGLVEFSHQSWCPVTKGKANYWRVASPKP